MAKQLSVGILLYRVRGGEPEIFLVHPGGPFWARKDDGASNRFSLDEWPPKSGKVQQFPEVDRASWFDLPAARQKLLPGQRLFLDQ